MRSKHFSMGAQRRRLPVIFTALVMVGTSMSLLSSMDPPVLAQGGDWIITEPGVVVENEYREMKNSIIIEDGGGLIVVNSTISFNLTVDGEEGLIVKTGATLEIYESTIRSGSLTYAAKFDSFGNIVMEDSVVERMWGSWKEGGGLNIMGGNAEIRNSVFRENKRDGLTVNSATATLEDSTFRENVVGIRAMDAMGLHVENNILRSNSQQGMLVTNSDLQIMEAEIDNNNIGIAISSSTVQIDGLTISDNSQGMDVAEGSEVTVSSSLVERNTGAGIRSSNSSLNIDNTEIRSNGEGIDAYGGALFVQDCTILGNDRGILTRAGTSGDINGNDIGGNAGYGVYSIGDDMKLTTNNFQPANGKGRRAVAWMFQVHIFKKNGEDVEGANVTIENRDGEEVFSGTTDEDGVTDTVAIIEYYEDHDGTEVEMTPHQVHFRTKDVSDSKKVTIDGNQTHEVEIGEDVDGGISLQIILVITGVLLLLVAVAIGYHIHSNKDDDTRKKRSTRKSGKRRSRRTKSLRSTKASREMRVRKGGKKRRKKR